MRNDSHAPLPPRPYGSWQAIAQTVTNPNTGRYRIGGLPAGSYRISAQATIYDQFYVYQPYTGFMPFLVLDNLEKVL